MLKLEESRRNALESKISGFHEGIGVCEQLLGIPIPLSYTRLTSRFLVLWHLTLPIMLWDDLPLDRDSRYFHECCFFVLHRRKPFPMLALDELCKLVHNNIQEAIASDKIIQAQLTAKIRSHSKEHSPNGRPTS
ncbi:hypothetical protein CMV_001360 [Castanea mollissima]|uniref:Uncharacterized protein n=1 Tax=Castanea mollissima TaxID=60419 RepID=A0A8J4RRQ0_9ROSI|nr:hypothetical protein CMV_001360 [Castanea mollissima]